MKVKELMDLLKTMDAEADVWLPGTTSDGIPTYSLLDHAFECKYRFICEDVYNTPGDIDERLLMHIKDENYNGNVVVLSSLYDFQSNRKNLNVDNN